MAQEGELTFLGLRGAETDLERAAIVVVPVSYDATSSWKKGADCGPRAILEASAYVETYDIETMSEVHERGIATLPIIEFEGPPEQLAEIVQREIGQVLDAGRLPVMLGGEHSVTIGAVRAFGRRVSSASVLQIDAHGDTRESYHGSTHNHACVMARAREICPIVQVGIRSLDTSEVASLQLDRVFFAHKIMRATDQSWMDRAIDLLSDDVYVTIDLDAFDPSVVPATGTPEPGGLDWYTVNEFIRRVAERKRVIAFDVVELLPQKGDHASAFTAAKLIHRFLSEIYVRR